MEIILSRHCKSFTGTLSRKHGYSICKRGKGFFGQRKGRNVPADGHLRFILDCAELAREGMLIADVRLMGDELIDAGTEAGICNDEMIRELSSLNEPLTLNDVMRYKTKYGL